MSHQSSNAPESSSSSRFSQNLRITNYGNQSLACNREKCSGRADLPLDLQELILAYLPALKIIELKRVCRTWRLILQSAKFKEKWVTTRGGCSHETLDLWVLKSIEGPSIAYIPTFKKHYWFLPLIFSHVVLESPPTAITCIKSLLEKSSFLGVDGPLIVFERAQTRSTSLHCTRRSISLCSYNTLTGQNSHLPMLQLGARHRILQGSLPTVIVVDRNQQEYCIIVETCMDGCYMNADIDFSQERRHPQHPFYTLQIYTSTTNTWTSYPEHIAERNDYADIFSGRFYQYDHGNNILYVWSPEQQWSRVHVTFPSTDNSHTQFVGTTETNAFKVLKCQRNVLMVESFTQREGRSMEQGFIVWKLMTPGGEPAKEQDSVKGEPIMEGGPSTVVYGATWFEISRTPAHLYLKGFKEESFLHPTFIVNGDCICTMASSDEYIPMLTYDVEHDSWYHRPELVKNTRALLSMTVSFTVPVKEEIKEEKKYSTCVVF